LSVIRSSYHLDYPELLRAMEGKKTVIDNIL